MSEYAVHVTTDLPIDTVTDAPGYKPGRVESRVYRCLGCGWHLTAKTKR